MPVSGIAVGEPERFVATEMLPEALPAEAGAKTALKLMLAFGANVFAVKPVTLKPVPVMLSDETTKFAVPVFFKVIACVEDVPSATLPKVTLEGVTDIPGCVPVPLSGIAVGEPDTLVTREILPETVAVEAGANVALKLIVLPAATVCAEKPVTPKPVPLAEAEETVKFAVPVFFRVIACVAVVPSATLPKLTLAGVTVIADCAPDPEPLNATVRLGFEALLATTRLPVTAADDGGVN